MALSVSQRSVVLSTIAQVKAITADGVTRSRLEDVREVLYQVAARPDEFPSSDFPSPAIRGNRTSIRYLLHQEPDQSYALYLNTLIRGKTTSPHNHGTWAVIVALEGEELNRICAREDDGSDPQFAKLRLVDEVVVRPGHGIIFESDDIHSVHIVGDRGARMFHVYGQALESLTERIGYDLTTGRVANYNKNFMSPTSR